MKEIPRGISIPSAEYRKTWLEMGVGFTLFPCTAYIMLLTADYSSVPPYMLWILIPIMSIIVFGMGYFLLNGLGMLLFCVERVEITREEIRLKLGFITIKRFSTQEILTVGYTEQGFGRKVVNYTPILVLSTEIHEKIIQSGEDKIRKDQSIQKQINRFNSNASAEQKGVYAYYINKTPLFMLGLRKGIALAYTDKRLEKIRQYISGAKYVV